MRRYRVWIGAGALLLGLMALNRIGPNWQAVCWQAFSAFTGIQTIPTLCWFKVATGWPCPTCGTTRATLALLRGDWQAVLYFYPLLPLWLLWLAVLLLRVWANTGLTLRWLKISGIVLIALTLVQWAVLIYRGI
jgi:hypothetical protein